MESLLSYLGLVALATAADGLLAGASLDQSIKQLPARHRMGALAFSAYSRAADLSNGIAWYAVLGVRAAALTLAALVAAVVLGVPGEQRSLLLVAGIFTVAHSLTTARAAPINFSQRKAGDNEQALSGILDRFERWQTLRAALQLVTFLVMLWAMAAIAQSFR